LVSLMISPMGFGLWSVRSRSGYSAVGDAPVTRTHAAKHHPVLAGQGIDSVRPIRDDIRGRVEALVASLR
jgi:hypothetical protein